MHLRRIIPVADVKYWSLPIAETRQNTVINDWIKKNFMICNSVTHTSMRHSCVLFYLQVPAGTHNCVRKKNSSCMFFSVIHIFKLLIYKPQTNSCYQIMQCTVLIIDPVSYDDRAQQ